LFLFRIEKKIGGVTKQEVQKEKETFSIMKWWHRRRQLEQEAEKKAEEAEPLDEKTKAVREVRHKFPTMLPEVAEQIVEVVLKSAEENEQKLAQGVQESTLSLLPGLTSHLVTLGGVVYKMTPEQWKEVEQVCEGKHGMACVSCTYILFCHFRSEECGGCPRSNSRTSPRRYSCSFFGRKCNLACGL
jgi:hypothetical protein